MTGMIDWDLAVAAGTRLAGQGPEVSRDEARRVVEELRACAARSTPLVRQYTGLEAAADTAPVLVVDRAGWVRANAEMFGTVVTPLVDRLEKRGATGGMTEAVGSRVTGLEVGALLGFLGSKVLGQFDPFHDPPGSPEVGRLLLVAPNIVTAEREMRVDPADFRLWVCLHEETHRVQFTAVPWMREHLQLQVDSLVAGVDLDPGHVGALLREAAGRVGDVLSGRAEGGLVELMATPAQREVIDRVTGVMSLLEGHADVVMDGVGPEVIPSVDEIRARFTRRRAGQGSLDKLLRRLLGLDAKMAQYRNGARFVRRVVREVGMDGFNKVWVEPGHLPTSAEIHDPTSWVRRVHG
jgi:coenzyme F420 biosynthesis associated uncharacterized protein